MKKKVYWMIAAVFVAIVGLCWFFALAFPPDPMIETYSAKMSEAYWMDPVHVQETITIKKENEEIRHSYRETWMSRDYYYIIQTGENGQKNTLSRWDKEGYLSSTAKNGSMNGAQTITSINFTYYRIDDTGNISYEQTEDQLIFTYNNKNTQKSSYTGQKFTQATSVAVFSNDWVLQSITATERWEEPQDDGSKIPMEQITQTVYLPCTQESFMEDVEKVVWGYRPDFPHLE